MPNYIWVGDNKNKGLAVFSKHKLKRQPMGFWETNTLYHAE